MRHKMHTKTAPARKVNWFFLLLVGIVGYFSYTVIAQQMHLNAVDNSYETASARLQAARQTNADLLEERSKLEDPGYIEKVAREELGMTKKDELPYISPGKEKTQ